MISFNYRFFKVGSTAQIAPSAVNDSNSLLNRTPSPRKQPSSSSWRQAIFQQVKTPSHNSPNGNYGCSSVTRDGRKQRTGELAQRIQRTGEDYKRLWQKAIKQQILLIRMEKENKRLKGFNQFVSSSEHLKKILTYMFLQLIKRKWLSNGWN